MDNKETECSIIMCQQ